MTKEESISLAEQLGLHCDYNDDPENAEDETIYLWHDADLEPAGGLLIGLAEGQAYVADMKTWGTVEVNGKKLRGNGDDDDTVRRCIDLYAERWKTSAPHQSEKSEAPLAEMPSGENGGVGRRRVQRRIGTFKAVDRLGHRHCIEIYSEVLAGNTEGPQSLLTADGETVEHIAKGQYRIMHGGVDLCSDDPAAP